MQRRGNAQTIRRVPNKRDIFTLIDECRSQNEKNKREILQRYEAINEKQTLLLERVIRLEEKRIENEKKVLEIEEKRVENEGKMLTLLNRFAEDLL